MPVSSSGWRRHRTCAQPDALPSACPPLYGLDLGTSEQRLHDRLGSSTRDDIVGDVKVMKYADLGAIFYLKRYAIYKITLLRERDGGVRRARRFLSMLFAP